MHKKLEYLSDESFIIVNDNEIGALINQAYFEIGNLQGVLSLIDEREIFLTPLVVAESVKSCNIENIHSTVLDQLENEALARKPLNSEQKQTNNYKMALLAGFEYLTKHENFDLELVLLVQGILEPEFSGIRDEQPLVIANTATGEILWTPPTGKQNILGYLENWLENCNRKDENENIVKAAVLHCQFEAIHPFMDGNGRTGRVLIILFLIYKGFLDYPCLYLSDYILKTRTYYYLYLQEGQVEKNYLGIVKYISKAIVEKSKQTTNIIKSTLQLKNDYNKLIFIQCPKIYSNELVDYLFSTPFYSIESIGKSLGLSRNTASKYISLLSQQGFIQQKQTSKTKVFYNPSFLRLLG